jgi:hypothetical protein
MDNEVVVHVRAEDSQARRVFHGIRDDAKKAGDDSGRSLTDSISTRFGQLGAKLGSVLPGQLAGAIGGLPPQGQAIAAVLVAGLAVSLAPMLGAAITAALLLGAGGGVLAAGIMAAADSPKVTAALDRFKSKAKKAFDGFGEIFEGPVTRAIGTFEDALDPLSASLKRMGTLIAPLIDELAPALVEFIKRALPGIEEAVKASVPLFEILADKLPEIGDAVSRFFEKIADNGPEAAQFFSDLIDTVIVLIDVIGTAIGWVTSFYSAWRRGIMATAGFMRSFTVNIVNLFGRILDAAANAFSWVPGIGGKLRAAQEKFSEFRRRVNNELGKIRDVEVTVRITAMLRNLTGSHLSDSALNAAFRKNAYGHGGIVGAASGGARSGMTLVGEHGPELVDLAAGSRVHSNEDSRRMMSGGGGSQPIIVQLMLDGRMVAEAIVDPLRAKVRQAGGGSVQSYLGARGVA